MVMLVPMQLLCKPFMIQQAKLLESLCSVVESLPAKKGFECESPPALPSDPNFVFSNCRTFLGN